MGEVINSTVFSNKMLKHRLLRSRFKNLVATRKNTIKYRIRRSLVKCGSLYFERLYFLIENVN